MWHAIRAVLLESDAPGLSHEAVIEIMVALLGVMVAVLGILGFLVSLIFGGLGLFGFQIIRDESTKAATTAAEKTARDVATQLIQEQMKDEQAIGLMTDTPTKKSPSATKRTGRKTSDAGLREESQ